MPQTFKFRIFFRTSCFTLLNLACVIYLQVRFELTFFALNPELNVVAPWREWDIQGREDAIEYAKKHNVPVPVTKKSIYSRDRNLWHLSHEVTIIDTSSFIMSLIENHCAVFSSCFQSLKLFYTCGIEGGHLGRSKK